MSHLQAFKEFVAAQPPEQEINHGIWRRCAVGDYARATIQPNRSFPGYLDEVVDSLDEEHQILFECLNHSGRQHYVGREWFDHVDISTYGKLNHYIKSLGA